MNAELETLKERLKADMDALKKAVGALAGGALSGELGELEGDVAAALDSNDPDAIYEVWKRVRKLLRKAMKMKSKQDYEADKSEMKRLRESATSDDVETPKAPAQADPKPRKPKAP